LSGLGLGGCYLGRLVVVAVAGFLEFFHCAGGVPGQFGQLLRAEQQDHDDQDDDPFAAFGQREQWHHDKPSFDKIPHHGTPQYGP
jgi:hypothetical protein